MSEILALLDLIMENMKATTAEIKSALDKGIYDNEVEDELVYQLGAINTLMTELERARKKYSDDKNVFW